MWNLRFYISNTFPRGAHVSFEDHILRNTDIQNQTTPWVWLGNVCLPEQVREAEGNVYSERDIRRLGVSSKPVVGRDFYVLVSFGCQLDMAQHHLRESQLGLLPRSD